MEAELRPEDGGHADVVHAVEGVHRHHVVDHGVFEEGLPDVVDGGEPVFVEFDFVLDEGAEVRDFILFSSFPGIAAPHSQHIVKPSSSFPVFMMMMR